jgi:hypothetical protein
LRAISRRSTPLTQLVDEFRDRAAGGTHRATIDEFDREAGVAPAPARRCDGEA